MQQAVEEDNASDDASQTQPRTERPHSEELSDPEDPEDPTQADGQTTSHQQMIKDGHKYKVAVQLRKRKHTPSLPKKVHHSDETCAQNSNPLCDNH